MLSDVMPLMTEYVQHWHPPVRNIHGRVIGDNGSTQHRARVVYSPGTPLGPASRDRVADAAATIWLFDHPRPVVIGDTFKLPQGDILMAARIERRVLAGAVLTKVFLT